MKFMKAVVSSLVTSEFLVRQDLTCDYGMNKHLITDWLWKWKIQVEFIFRFQSLMNLLMWTCCFPLPLCVWNSSVKDHTKLAKVQKLFVLTLSVKRLYVTSITLESPKWCHYVTGRASPDDLRRKSSINYFQQNRCCQPLILFSFSRQEGKDKPSKELMF